MGTPEELTAMVREPRRRATYERSAAPLLSAVLVLAVFWAFVKLGGLYEIEVEKALLRDALTISPTTPPARDLEVTRTVRDLTARMLWASSAAILVLLLVVTV